MKSNVIIEKLYKNLNQLYKKYNPALNTNDNLEILDKVSTKSQELQKLGICLYYIENSNEENLELIFETLNKKWWEGKIELIEELHNYLTGNVIKIKLKQIEGSIINYQIIKKKHENLSLFSGGLDSLIGSFYLLKRKQNFILSHTKTSNSMYGKAKKVHNSSKLLKKVPLFSIDSQFKEGSINPRSPQTRTLLFVLNSVPLCEHFGINEIHIFENIALMINPPISAYAFPTKTTRPEVIAAINNLFEKFLDYELKIKLPFRFYTKAEMIAGFKDKKDIMKGSFSCFYYRGKKKMCGKCYGCFIRIVSLAANSIIEENNYRSNFLDFKKEPQDETDYDKFLVILDLLKFCRKMLLDEEFESHLIASINNANIFDDIDIWESLLRFSKDVFLGIQNYYSLKHLDIKNYIIGKKFSEYFELIDKGLLKERKNYLNQLEIK